MYKEFVELGYIEDGPSSWTGTSIRDRTFDTKEMTKEHIKELEETVQEQKSLLQKIGLKK